MGIFYAAANLNSKITWSTGELISYLVGEVESVKNRKTFSAAQEKIATNLVKNRSITIYIDDLDQGTEGSNRTKISALINAVRKLSADNPEIKFGSLSELTLISYTGLPMKLRIKSKAP